MLFGVQGAVAKIWAIKLAVYLIYDKRCGPWSAVENIHSSDPHWDALDPLNARSDYRGSIRVWFLYNSGTYLKIRQVQMYVILFDKSLVLLQFKDLKIRQVQMYVLLRSLYKCLDQGLNDLDASR